MWLRVYRYTVTSLLGNVLDTFSERVQRNTAVQIVQAIPLNKMLAFYISTNYIYVRFAYFTPVVSTFYSTSQSDRSDPSSDYMYIS